MESSDYSNRLIKRRNWEEIVEIFCEAGDDRNDATRYNAIDPSTPSFPPTTFTTYNRGYCTVQRNTPSMTSVDRPPTSTPSPASTLDSELMELYGS
nr:unnamed protein product [Callosobruchus chinensis]